MLKKLTYISCLLLQLICAGCTHNNGNIGNFFGQWKLTDIIINDESLPDYEGNVYWSFQNSTINIKEINSNHIAKNCYGNWKEYNGNMVVDFPDNNEQDYTALHTIKLGRLSELEIIVENNRHMILKYIPNSKTNIVYKFDKF